LSFVVSSSSTRFVEMVTKRVETGELILDRTAVIDAELADRARASVRASRAPPEVAQAAERDIDAWLDADAP